MSNTLTDPLGSDELSDRAVALLRTAVPALWGTVTAALLGWLATYLPTELHEALADALAAPVVSAVVVAAAIAAWYWVWRRLEPHIPDWLTRVVLGSARTPIYAPVTHDGVAIISDVSAAAPTAVIVDLDEADRANLASLRDALDEFDPGRLALTRVLGTVQE